MPAAPTIIPIWDYIGYISTIYYMYTYCCYRNS